MTSFSLSVIIPIYNGAEFIENLVTSLTHHTFKEVEYIFIDNNSTDNSIALLKSSLEHTGLQYQLLQEEQQGPGYARNKGIKAAKGTYLAFLDCDDAVHPEKYAKDLDVFSTHNPDFVFCRAKREYWDGRVLTHPIEGIQQGVNTPPALGMIWLRNFFKLQGPGSMMVKKRVIQDLGGFHTSMTGEDAFLFIKMGLRYKGFFYDQEYYHYYRHPESLISSVNKELKTPILRYLPLRLNLYEDSMVKKHKEALKLLAKQINVDLLKLHQMDYKPIHILKDSRILEFKRSPWLFNKMSLAINKRVPHVKYNPFYQLWNRFLTQ